MFAWCASSTRHHRWGVDRDQSAVSVRFRSWNLPTVGHLGRWSLCWVSQSGEIPSSCTLSKPFPGLLWTCRGPRDLATVRLLMCGRECLPWSAFHFTLVASLKFSIHFHLSLMLTEKMEGCTYIVGLTVVCPMWQRYNVGLDACILLWVTLELCSLVRPVRCQR